MRKETRAGAHWDGEATQFSLFAGHASSVELCLFDGVEDSLGTRHPLSRGADGMWSARLPGVGPGQLYGYRVHGEHDPRRGLRHNPAKLLVDPYARSVVGELRWNDAVYGFARGASDRPSPLDSAPFVPRSRVVDPTFDWGDERPPRRPWSETLIYECHVRGMTELHPRVPATLRGTFLGLAHEAVIEHLLSLGVTALELLPVQHRVSEHRLERLGLSNYWGYNSLAFFAPDRRFAAHADPYVELKQAVRSLHAAGIEVILDIALNHTAEGDHRGPTLSLKGIDNLGYYRLEDDDPSRYVNYSGCGNTLDVRRPAALRLVLDCLRHWVEEMHVDGFRFDLAPVLGRDPQGFSPEAPFFRAVAADPLLSRVKMIAEPWDLGPEGYRLGGFPPPWREWNDRWRDTVRGFWRGDPGRVAELASRLAGSRDLFPGRPLAGVHYAACHDGFTLRDVVSYEKRHNLANGEGNRDGHGHNLSRNWGVEGPTDDPEIRALRRRIARNLLATVLLSRGVPMLGHGDELGRTQQGNNNAYCQDDRTSWIDWVTADEEPELLAFVRRVAALRRDAKALWATTPEEGLTLFWLHPEGRPMRDEDWHDGELRALGLWMKALPPDGEALLLLNAAAEARSFALPEGAGWRLELDSGDEEPRAPRAPGPPSPAAAAPGTKLIGRSLQWWVRPGGL